MDVAFNDLSKYCKSVLFAIANLNSDVDCKISLL